MLRGARVARRCRLDRRARSARAARRQFWDRGLQPAKLRRPRERAGAATRRDHTEGQAQLTTCALPCAGATFRSGRALLLLLHFRDQAREAVLRDDLVELSAVVLDEADAVGLDVPRLELVALLLEHVV